MKRNLLLCLILLMGVASAQVQNRFAPMDTEWRTPDEIHLASGAPGPGYWQQQTDYQMEIELDEKQQEISGKETITYTNNSPHTLDFLWVQLDQNTWSRHSTAQAIESAPKIRRAVTQKRLDEANNPVDGGLNLLSLTDEKGRKLSYSIVETNLRIDLGQPLAPGKQFRFKVEWSYPIIDAKATGDRAGYEYFAADDNYIFEIAQFYPRMAAYTAEEGWHTQPYFGPGEFALEFGNFEVEITVPADHIVAATGELSNGEEVLESAWKSRLETAKRSPGKKQSVISGQEARSRQGNKTNKTRTWKFKAENVRDFAFASSRKFAWDAMSTEIGGKKVLVQSFYPVEGMPLWDTYATHAASHTLEVYSRMTIDYPYPTCNVVHGAVWGMEYPMVAFCGGRPDKRGNYSKTQKYAMIGVVIHEVGHNFFPMIVNSDERRWAWMDEGLNSFLEYVTEQEFETDYPSRRGFPSRYALSSAQIKNPIMTNPESMIANGLVTYTKTATALNILRETIIGREGFDRAFKAYAERWAFKHPQPEDFFRTMEEVSGKELDWFWRNWFYTVDVVDIAIRNVEMVKPVGAGEEIQPSTLDFRESLSVQRFREQGGQYVESHPELRDEYSPENNAGNENRSGKGNSGKDAKKEGFLCQIELENVGGCPSPVILQIGFEDGSETEIRLPAEIWMTNSTTFRKEFFTEKKVAWVMCDPWQETADADMSNNRFPQEIQLREIRQY